MLLQTLALNKCIMWNDPEMHLVVTSLVKLCSVVRDIVSLCYLFPQCFITLKLSLILLSSLSCFKNIFCDYLFTYNDYCNSA